MDWFNYYNKKPQVTKSEDFFSIFEEVWKESHFRDQAEITGTVRESCWQRTCPAILSPTYNRDRCGSGIR